jgi:sorbitol/mannitol transport system substrate-binding protein
VLRATLPLLVCLGGGLAALAGCGSSDAIATLTVATVNNGDMVTMKELSSDFEHLNPDIHLKWVVLEENVLRQRVTTDVATRAGQFDVVTVGNNQVPMWAKEGLLTPVSNLPADYELGDLLKPVRDAVSYDMKIYALPFYAESAMTYYRTDLFAKAGLKMPQHPTYEQIAAFARRLNDRPHQTYGICLRGKPGDNIPTVTSLVHAFGGRWFDPGWHAAIDTPEWRYAITYYRDLLVSSGPPGVTSNGFNENLVLFAGGHCAIWIDATVAATLLYDPARSQIARTVDYAPMPIGNDVNAPTWLWTWNLAVPVSSKHVAAAMKFVAWATSRDYIRLVAKTQGWIRVPPGTRQSTYDNPEYRQAAPFAGFVLNAIKTAIPTATDTVLRPYSGAQVPAVPEFPEAGMQVGEIIAATLDREMTVDAALKNAQAITERIIEQAGYPK